MSVVWVRSTAYSFHVPLASVRRGHRGEGELGRARRAAFSSPGQPIQQQGERELVAEVVPLPVELRWRSTWSSGGDHGFIMTHGSDSFGGDVRVERGA